VLRGQVAALCQLDASEAASVYGDRVMIDLSLEYVLLVVGDLVELLLACGPSDAPGLAALQHQGPRNALRGDGELVQVPAGPAHSVAAGEGEHLAVHAGPLSLALRGDPVGSFALYVESLVVEAHPEMTGDGHEHGQAQRHHQPGQQAGHRLSRGTSHRVPCWRGRWSRWWRRSW